jgi:hypothetical protein
VVHLSGLFKEIEGNMSKGPHLEVHHSSIL